MSTSPSSSRSRHLRREVGDKCNAAAYSRTPIPLQSSPRRASPRTPGARDCACPCSRRNESGRAFSGAFLEPRVAADDAVPPDIPLLAGRSLAGQVVQPATERSSSDHADGNTSPDSPALTPRLNVNQPPGLARLVLETSQIHRSSSTLRRSLTCRAIALPNRGAETGRLRADHGRQDKSAAFGRAHVIGWIGDFRHLAHLTCWRLRLKRQRTQCPKRHPGDLRRRFRA